ncbi:hypothetical protein DL93DRAFT_2054306 [Clavulina sp. PMI_390]|nr:hypothetical protein DL93DRAFT_2054306 [Clavulina sp. PMI_390]
MGRLNFDVDEATLLSTYRISSLNPTRWEDIDHEDDMPLSSAMMDTPSAQNAEYVDPLGLNNGAIDTRNMDSESRAAISISSKSFDPKTFLSVVHPNATHQDLSYGTQHLGKVLESRSQAIRVLVEDNFDHFVAVKASTEALHAYMQTGVLDPKSEYGAKILGDKLRESSAKADQVFHPMIDTASKAQRVRSTLGVFERSTFFFNLHGTLAESIEAGRYDAALRDYNKGKFLLESRPGQLITGPGGASILDARGQLQPQAKRIVDKVWAAVEKVMGQMKSALISQLQEPTRSVEDQIKTIETLLEMNVTDDPVWVYFDSQHKYILSHLRKIYEDSAKAIEGARARIRASPPTHVQKVEDLRTCIEAIDSPAPETIITKALGADVWTATVTLARNLSEALLTSLPSFWKIAKDYLDGKFKKGGSSASRRSPSQCRTMALDIVRLYIALISEFFSLSDKAVVSPSSSKNTHDLPAFVPVPCNSITSAWHMSRILAEIGECVSDVTTVELAGDAASGLKSLLESARWRFEVATCDLWLQDAVRLHELENWTLDPDRPATTTYLHGALKKFQVYSATSAYKIAGGIDASKHGTSVAKQIAIGREFGQRIQKTFVDSLYALLDGLEKLSRSDYTPPGPSGANVAMTAMTSPFVPTEASQKALGTIDASDRDTRMLLVISAFGHMRKEIIPGMLNQLESALSVSIGRERDMLEEVVEQLDETLFNDYAKGKSAVASSIIRKGVLESGMDWFETPRPTQVRDYVYQALLSLVRAHVQITGVAKPLLERAMTTIVDDLTNEAFSCFQKVERFGMGGMLAATLEIEFLHQTLVQFVSPAASKTLAAIYNSISAAYSRRPQGGGGGGGDLQKELEGVKRTLHESRRATAIEFLCFKPTKESSGSGSGHGKEGASTGGGLRPTTPVTSTSTRSTTPTGK